MSTLDPFAGATEMLRALRRRELSAVELLEHHLARIERFNPALNAIVTLNTAQAWEQARAADGARARGEEAPLLGLPMTVKDCIETRGLPTTGGVAERANEIAPEDARPVARLRAAGSVLLGKTNSPPYASDWQSDNPLFGRSVNPWNEARTPGGSTGGGAAAVAAGLSALELGGDFCGSIRIPAAFCGIYGHKPSISAVSGTGHFPVGLIPSGGAPLAVIGPLARDPADLEMALHIIAGPEAAEEPGWRLTLPPPRHEHLRDFRVGVLPALPWQAVDEEILQVLAQFTDDLRRAGATVAEAAPLGPEEVRAYFHAYTAVMATVSSDRLSADERHWQAERCRSLGDEMLDAWADGLEISGQEYVSLLDRREEYRAAFGIFFRQWDVLVSPANIVNAYAHMPAPFPDRLMDEDCRLQVNDTRVIYDRQAVYPSLANFSGYPATAFPVGQTLDGLPIGLQALAPYLEDRTGIAFARAVRCELGGYEPPPGYASSPAPGESRDGR